ncbi:Fe2OG dioxygenase domain-containing protein [Durusdinium trenchii]|uniref:Fe2OG dioxygenase domain-containing protein n=1 Tax=Durusdinium trenchii TaxID=1381693 RepID=A0ABP0HGM4_9DINO
MDGQLHSDDDSAASTIDVLPYATDSDDEDVGTSIMDRFTSILEALPNPLFASGIAKNAPCLYTKGGVPLALPEDLADLRALCKQAPCGRGTETVLDLEVRRSKETQDVDILWDDLGFVLSQARATLCPDVSLTAKVYKVLLYELGDFFQAHVDSKISDDHIMTLMVDCGAGPCDGGQLSFPERGCVEAADRSQEATEETTEVEEKTERTWRSECAGSWCSFFTSDFHSVEKVTAGHRVMVTFNIFGHPDPQEEYKVMGATKKPQRSMLSLPQHILKLVTITRRDWALYKALVARGVPCRLVECVVSCETKKRYRRYEERDNWQLSRARIGQDMTEDSCPYDWQRQPMPVPSELQALAGAEVLSRDEVSFLTDTNVENDFGLPRTVWPFRGVTWAVSRRYFKKHLLQESKWDSVSKTLSGNQACFRMFYYRRAALLCEMGPRSRRRHKFDPDFFDRQERRFWSSDNENGDHELPEQ